MATLLITGAGGGIGLGFVRSYAAEGWVVHACCRNPERSSDLKSVAGEVHVHRMDVTDGLRVAGVARDLGDEPIDVLINNAAVYGPESGFGHSDFDDWRAVLEVNTLAPLRVAERFSPHLERSALKRLVNISSGYASIAHTTEDSHLAYRASKAALNMVTRAIAVALEVRGVTAIAMDPGWVQTAMGGSSAPLTVEASVSGMRSVIAGLELADSGGFLRYDGETVPW